MMRQLAQLLSGETAPIGAVSQKAAAELMKVSRRSTQRAAAIKNDPDLAPAVERGHATVADAYQVRDEPAEVKRRAVEAVEAGEAPTLAGAVRPSATTSGLPPPPSGRAASRAFTARRPSGTRCSRFASSARPGRSIRGRSGPSRPTAVDPPAAELSCPPRPADDTPLPPGADPPQSVSRTWPCSPDWRSAPCSEGGPSPPSRTTSTRARPSSDHARRFPDTGVPVRLHRSCRSSCSCSSKQGNPLSGSASLGGAGSSRCPPPTPPSRLDSCRGEWGLHAPVQSEQDRHAAVAEPVPPP